MPHGGGRDTDRVPPARGPGSERTATGMTRIAFIGAGSVEFTRNLLGDIFSFPELADAEIVLHDIDEERLATAAAMAHWTNDTLGARGRIVRPPTGAALSTAPTSPST